MAYVRKQLNLLIELLFFQNQGIIASLLRRIAFAYPLAKAVILYEGGFISKAKQVTDSHHYSNANYRRIKARINEISYALDQLAEFRQSVLSYYPAVDVHAGSDATESVLMVVNSCYSLDANGYGVRSSQIANALCDVGVFQRWLARLGYPWDMLNRRETPPVSDSVVSAEGAVRLCHDPKWRVGEADSVYWHAYADYIVEHYLSLDEKPGVIHAYSKYSNGIASALAARKLNIPVVYEMRGLWHVTRAHREPTFDYSDFYNYEEQMEVWAAELADAVVVISDTLKQWLIERSVAEEKIWVIPNAVSEIPESASIEGATSKTGILKLAFMGSITPYEGLDCVIKAVALANKASGVTVTLDVYGDGKARTALEKQAKKLIAAGLVTFHGRVEKNVIAQRIPDYDVFPVVRTNSEVTRLIPPLKHLEPMANGKTVIISDLPALTSNVPQVIANEAVAPDNQQQLAEKFIHYASNRALLDGLGKASREWVKANRTWAVNGKAYKTLYASLTVNKARSNEP